MSKLRDWLQGKKTYLAALGIALTATAKFLDDNDLNSLLQSLWAAFGLISIRRAIANK